MAEATGDTVAPQKSGRGWLWGISILILLSVGIFFFTHRKTDKGAGNEGAPAGAAGARGPTGSGGAGSGRGGFGGPIMVAVAPAQKGDIGVYVSALGYVTPLNTVAVRSRVDGQLVKLLYTEGQWVHEGDPLAEIDPAPFQAALDQAEGQLARDTAS